MHDFIKCQFVCEFTQAKLSYGSSLSGVLACRNYYHKFHDASGDLCCVHQSTEGSIFKIQGGPKKLYILYDKIRSYFVEL